MPSNATAFFTSCKPAVKIHMDSCVTGTRMWRNICLNNFVCNSLSNYCWYYFVLEAPLILHTHVKCHSRAAAVRVEKRILLLGLAWLEPSISHRSHLFIYIFLASLGPWRKMRVCESMQSSRTPVAKIAGRSGIRAALGGW